MLDIRVQTPAGTIYAEFSYTFINEQRSESASMSSLPTSAPHSPRIGISHNSSDSNGTGETDSVTTIRDRPHSRKKLLIPSPPSLDTLVSPNTVSPLDSYDVIELDSPASLASVSHEQYESQPLSAESKDIGTMEHYSRYDQTSSPSSPHTKPTPVRSYIEDGLEDDEDSTEPMTGGGFIDEPDAGEHFMQATSEFFSKVG